MRILVQRVVSESHAHTPVILHQPESEVWNREAKHRHRAGDTARRPRSSRDPRQSSRQFFPTRDLTRNPSHFREQREGSRSLGGHEPPPPSGDTYPLPSTPPPHGRIPVTLGASGKPTTRSQALSSRPNQAERKMELTGSQPDISRRGGNPRSPRTGIFGRGSRVGAPVLGPAPPPRPGCRSVPRPAAGF